MLIAAPGLIQGAVSGHEDLASQQMSVRELMRLDTALALEQARARLRQQKSGHAMADNSSIAHSGPLKLVAIYGVGKKLLAEVVVGHRRHVYMRGQAWAVGMKDSPSAYRLRGISASCVHLERNDEQHTLCLHPGLEGDR